MNEYRNPHVLEKDMGKTFGELMEEGRLKWIAGHTNLEPEQGVRYQIRLECVGYDEKADQYLLEYTPVKKATEEEDCVPASIDDRE